MRLKRKHCRRNRKRVPRDGNRGERRLDRRGGTGPCARANKALTATAEEEEAAPFGLDAWDDGDAATGEDMRHDIATPDSVATGGAG